MPVTNTHIAIPKNVSTNNDLDFHYLRKLGIEYIEELGGRLWTDFNSHDPGITMLEMLCYAITDLGMRVDLPIQDLLASNDVNLQLNNQFYKASDIFPTKSVTANDYRKLFIDIKGVRNCWLRIAKRTVYADCKNDTLSYEENAFSTTKDEFKKTYDLKGLYTLLVDFEPIPEKQLEGLSEKEKEKKITEIKQLIKDEIFEKYHANRNLCEDLLEVTEVPEKPIAVCASVAVATEADEELIHAKILTAINDYFSTTLRFYSIKEMLDKGYTTDEIFDGPFLLDNGFIDAKELAAADLRSEVRMSDIMKIIMNIEGVKHINNISIGNCDPNDTLLNEWVICIPKDTKPVLCDDSAFSYNKGVLPLNINETQVNLYLEQLQEDAEIENTVPEDERDLEFPESNFLAPDTYTTIQNDFPETYGIGQSGLAARATTERKSQAKQLKGYLLFFDKILASYFKHLGNVSQLLSINGGLDKTYFTQVVEDIDGFNELVNNYPTNVNDSSNEILTDLLFEKQDNTIERRNMIVDHLLARFAESFGDYAFLMKALFGSATNEIILENKREFLDDYITISSERGSAFNYYNQNESNLWGTDNISGAQKRIARLVGIKNYNRRNLSESFVDIYALQNSQSKTVFRWRIKDENKNIILSATEAYTTIPDATEELYFAVLQIIQTSQKEVLAIFEKGITDDTTIGNIRIHQANSGKYSFDIINPEKPESSSDHIIAKQFKYYETINEVKEAIVSIIAFMKFKFTEEGIFLVEHILLRPHLDKNSETPKDSGVSFLPICTDNCEDDCGIDPYSYRLSIVIPGYTYRFSNPDFRNYMENIIKEELPAHILPKICWVGYRENNLENVTAQYLQQLDNEEESTINQIEEQITIVQNTVPPPIDVETQIATLETQKKEVPLIIIRRKTAYYKNIKQLNDNDLEAIKTIDKEAVNTIAAINDQITIAQNQIPVPEDIEKQIALLQAKITDTLLHAEEKKIDYLIPLNNIANDLATFENKYKNYLFAKTALYNEQPPEELEELINAMANLNTIYPVGRLLDCEDESDELEGKIILGQTNIGTL